MARIFIVDSREYPDPDPNLNVEQVRDLMASFFPELATATHTERTRGDDTLYEFSRRVGTKGPSYNATCPYCGQDELKASVDTITHNVPLEPDDFDVDQGNEVTNDISDIVCGNCGREVPTEHYMEHNEDGDPCDCNEPVIVDLSGEQSE